MEKRVYSAICLLVMCAAVSASVSAQDIALGGKEYPSIILIPLISIVLSLLILVAILIRNAKSIHLPKFPASDHHTAKHHEHREENSRKGFFRAFQKKEEGAKHEVNYLRDIKKFRKELAAVNEHDAFNTLSEITKKFFKDLLKINYEFTYNELVYELKKHGRKKELIDIAEKFSELKYSEGGITKEGIQELAGEIEGMLRREKIKGEEKKLGFSMALAKREKTGFFHSVHAAFRSKEEKKKEILSLLDREQDALKKDMDIAKTIYQKALKSYYSMSPDERKEMYERLMGFYQEVNKMLFSSFYNERSKKQLRYFSGQLAKLKEDVESRQQHETKKNLRHKQKKDVSMHPEHAEDMKKLQAIEDEAMKRIKFISESVQNPLLAPEQRERETVREIKDAGQERYQKFLQMQKQQAERPKIPPEIRNLAHHQSAQKMPSVPFSTPLMEKKAELHPGIMPLPEHQASDFPKSMRHEIGTPIISGAPSRKIRPEVRPSPSISSFSASKSDIFAENKKGKGKMNKVKSEKELLQERLKKLGR